MDTSQLLKVQMDALKKENLRLIEQMGRVSSQAEYYKKTTEEFIKSSDDDYKLKHLLFQKHIDEIMSSSAPINTLLKNFYIYLIKHMEIERMVMRLNELENNL